MCSCATLKIKNNIKKIFIFFMSDDTWLTVNAAGQELCSARHFKSNVEIQNSISFQGAVLKDIDNNASACNWSNLQPIRGPKQVTELQFGTTFL